MTFVDLELKNINKTISEIERMELGIKTRYPKIVKETAIFGFRQIKTKYPKRSGFARKSFQLASLTPISYEIASKAPQVAVLENGAKAHTIRPKRRKFLTIPIKNSVRTKTGIKQSALNKLFKELKSRGKKGKTTREVFQDVGIVLAKKANIPARRALKPLEREFVPIIDKKMLDSTNSMLSKLGFA